MRFAMKRGKHTAKVGKAGWSLDYVSALHSRERTIWIADAHRSDGKRFVVRADEKPTAFLELELATRAGAIVFVT
jgi:hypothetical protein